MRPAHGRGRAFMDKTVIRKYAVWARNELLERVSRKAVQFGVAADATVDADADSIHGILLTPVQKQQRRALIAQVERSSWSQVMEEVSYTWFNRFCALRFMEVNGYLPSHVRVFTDEHNCFQPQILSEALDLDLPGLNPDIVVQLHQESRMEDLFNYLLITQCNALSRELPGMFQKIQDFTELLLPDHLLREGSVIEQMVTRIPEEDWKDQVQILGWLYQYYNSELKTRVFSQIARNIKVSGVELPAITQLFTPHWLVRYMVENSLGRIFLTGLRYGPWGREEVDRGERLRSGWTYYMEDAPQTPEGEQVLRDLESRRARQAQGLPFVDTTFLDPCMGSGHILVEAFDLFMDIYTSQGWSQRDAARRILEVNLFGLDIDERAAQLAYFAVMMKARQYDRRILTRGIRPNIYSVRDSDSLSPELIRAFLQGNPQLERELQSLLEDLRGAREYGSICLVRPVRFDALLYRAREMAEDPDCPLRDEVVESLIPFLQTGRILAGRFDVTVTNPPYMAISNGSPVLQAYVKEHFPLSRTDLYAVFLERCAQLTSPGGCQAMLTQHTWMFLSSYTGLRKKLLLNHHIVSMAHLGSRCFEDIGGEVVQTTSFVLRNCPLPGASGTYARLVNAATPQDKEALYLSGDSRYTVPQDIFTRIPGSLLSYWISTPVLESFRWVTSVGSYGRPLQGIVTGDNDRFLRLWHEVSFPDILFDCETEEDTEEGMWVPHSKGGPYRRWYGNQDYVINWADRGEEIRGFTDSRGKLRSRIQNVRFFFHPGITWSDLTTGKFAARYVPAGFTFNVTGPTFFPNRPEDLAWCLAYFNSPVFQTYLDICCPGLHYHNGTLATLPARRVQENLAPLVEDTVFLAKQDWDSFEVSWEFGRHPLVQKGCTRIADAFQTWSAQCEERFRRMKRNEEELNGIFIRSYGLTGAISPEVKDEDITIRRADLGRDIRSLLSYAVGCLFGRYSLDTPGLFFAGGDFNPFRYGSFTPVLDNVIPIGDDDWFQSDITNQITRWVRAVYGEETLEENLDFIATALGGRGPSRQVIRRYFLQGFWTDHLKTYQRRPIYWLFDSGRENGFKCLIYLHRYHPLTLARIRTDYIHEQQSRYRTAMQELRRQIALSAGPERANLTRRMEHLQRQSDEVRIYEEKIHHLADAMIHLNLDDGVRANYEKLQGVLARLK